MVGHLFSCTLTFEDAGGHNKIMSTDCKEFIRKRIYMSATCSAVSEQLSGCKVRGTAGNGVILDIYTGTAKNTMPLGNHISIHIVSSMRQASLQRTVIAVIAEEHVPSQEAFKVFKIPKPLSPCVFFCFVAELAS
jgi:hypothetical protein